MLRDLPHPFSSHLDYVPESILRRDRRRMTMRNPEDGILLNILLMVGMTETIDDEPSEEDVDLRRSTSRSRLMMSAATPHITVILVTARFSIPAPIPSPSLPLLPSSHVLSPTPPPSPIRLLGYRAAMIRLRAEAASTSHSLPLPPPFILSPTRSDAPSIKGLPHPRPYQFLLITTIAYYPLHSRGQTRGYHYHLRREFVSTLGPRYEIVLKAWRRSMDASALAHGEVMSLFTTVLGQMLEIRELHAADRRRQAMTLEMLKADHRRSAEMRELRTTDRTRQHQLIQTLTVMQSLITGTGDHTTGTCDSTTGTGYRTAGTAGTRWRSCTARAARGGW
ncbi:hypothetical protein Tco_0257058 [Tanacetum coccineum]